MEARRKVISNIFYHNSIEDLIYEILDEDLFDKEMWPVDLHDFLEDVRVDDYDSDQFDEYHYRIKKEDYILYYEGNEPVLVAFETKDERDTFIDVVKANKEHVYLKNELMEMFKPYVDKLT